MNNTKILNNSKIVNSNKLMNDTKSIRKTTYTSDKVIIIVGVLGVIFVIVYIYNNYKKIVASVMPKATGGTVGATCPDYWDSIGNSKCQNSKKIGSCSKTDGADVMDFSSDVFTNVNTSPNQGEIYLWYDTGSYISPTTSLPSGRG